MKKHLIPAYFSLAVVSGCTTLENTEILDESLSPEITSNIQINCNKVDFCLDLNESIVNNNLLKEDIQKIIDKYIILWDDEKIIFIRYLIVEFEKIQDWKEIFNDYVENIFFQHNVWIWSQKYLDIFRLYLLFSSDNYELPFWKLTIDDIWKFYNVSKVKTKEQEKAENINKDTDTYHNPNEIVDNKENKQYSLKMMYKDYSITSADIEKIVNLFSSADEFRNFYDNLDGLHKTALKERIYRYITSSSTSIFHPEKLEQAKIIKIFQVLLIIDWKWEVIDGQLTQNLIESFFKFKEREGSEYFTYVEWKERMDDHQDFLHTRELISDLKIIYKLAFDCLIRIWIHNEVNRKVFSFFIDALDVHWNNLDIDKDNKISLFEVEELILNISKNKELTHAENEILEDYISYISAKQWIEQEYNYTRRTKDGTMYHYTNINDHNPPIIDKDYSLLLEKYKEKTELAWGLLNKNTNLDQLKIRVLEFLREDTESWEKHLNNLRELTNNENLDIYNLSAKEVWIVSVYISSSSLEYDYRNSTDISEYGYTSFKKLQASNNKLTWEELKIFYNDLIAASLSFMAKSILFAEEYDNLTAEIHTRIVEKYSEVNYDTIRKFFDKEFSYTLLKKRNHYYHLSETAKKSKLDHLWAEQLFDKGTWVCRHYSFLATEIFNILKQIQENDTQLQNTILVSKHTIWKHLNERYAKYTNLTVWHAYNNLVTVWDDWELYISQIDYQGWAQLDNTFRMLLQDTLIHASANPNLLVLYYKVYIWFKNNTNIEAILEKILNIYLIDIKKNKEKEKIQNIVNILGFTPYSIHTELRMHFYQELINLWVTDSDMLSKVFWITQGDLSWELMKIQVYMKDNNANQAYNLMFTSQKLFEWYIAYQNSLRNNIDYQAYRNDVNMRNHQWDIYKWTKYEQKALYDSWLIKYLPVEASRKSIIWIFNILKNQLWLYSESIILKKDFEKIWREDSRLGRISDLWMQALLHFKATDEIIEINNYLKGYWNLTEEWSLLQIMLLIYQNKDWEIQNFLKSNNPWLSTFIANAIESWNPKKYLLNKDNTIILIWAALYNYWIINLLWLEDNQADNVNISSI